MTKITPAQQRNLDFIRENGPVITEVCGIKGWSLNSARTMVAKGLLVKIDGYYHIATEVQG